MPELKKSKLIQNTVNRMPELESYSVEECDNEIQHWVYAAEGYWFPEHETSSICGFNVREVNREIKRVAKDERPVLE